MIVRQPANEGIVRYLEPRSKSGEPDVRPPRDQHRDYWECGAHPDIVERVWDALGRNLPADCRQVVLGTPVLIHPPSGVILAAAVGTQYALRLPTHAWRNGLPQGVKTETVWSGGTRMDIQQEFGSDWIFGNWSDQEPAWCSETFNEAGTWGL